jgi:hypothetical protein
MIIRCDYIGLFRNYGGDRNAVYERHSCFHFMNSCWQAEILPDWSKCMIFAVLAPIG